MSRRNGSPKPAKSTARIRAFFLTIMIVMSLIGSMTIVTNPVAASNHAALDVENTSAGAHTNHNWSIVANDSVNATLEAVVLDYNSTGTDIGNVSNLSVTVNGTGHTVSNVTVDEVAGTVNVTLDGTDRPTVAGGETINVTSSTEEFINPSSNGTYTTTINLVGENDLDPVDSDSVEFTIGDGVTEPATGTLNGTVTDAAGTAIGNATVFVSENESLVTNTTTAPDGNYSLELETGTYDLRVEADNYDNGYAENVSITENETTRADFQLNETVLTGTLNGTVTDDSGTPIENATVSVSENESFVTNTTTASDGTYSLEVETGNYSVSADTDGYDRETKNATITENVTTTIDFALTSESDPTGNIAGQVTDTESGDGIENATVSLSDGESAELTVTDENGNYSLELTIGTYDLLIEADGYEEKTEHNISVTENTTTTVDVALSPSNDGNDDGGDSGDSGDDDGDSSDSGDDDGGSTDDSGDNDMEDNDSEGNNNDDTDTDSDDTTTDEEQGEENTADHGDDDTASDEDENDDDTDEDIGGDSVPGFGITVTLITLLSAALLSYRRE